MRIILVPAAVVLVIGAAASAVAEDNPTAFIVRPIHDAQVVRGDDGMDHVEYDLLVVSVLPESFTLTSIAVLDPAGKQLKRIEGDDIAAVTQPLFAHNPTKEITASAAVVVEMDLALLPDTVPERLMHQIAYALEPGSVLTPMYDDPEVDAPEVIVDRRPAIVIKPPLTGDGWFVSSGCCKPNLHRDLRVAADGLRIATPEDFDIDWAKIKGTRIFDGDGSRNEDHYAFGEDVLAVADGTIVSVQDGKPDATPNVSIIPLAREDYGGNHVILQIAPDVFAIYVHLQENSVAVNVGDAVKAGARLARIGNTGPSMGPHLHFGLHDKPDFFVAKSLPFVFDSYTSVGSVDFDKSEGDRVVITPDSRKIQNAYPIYGSIQNYP